ncbi:histidine kinase [Parafilimonas sp.]|uniref:histidine kinase n=1 Tax=Parafilimonas sp. TaxID=1969739 RepID=UPI0039E3435D
MEFDNDRPIRHAYKIEMLYWLLLAVISPMVNSLTVFIHNIRIWWVLLLINLFILPAYLFYSAFIVRRFLFEKKYIRFSVLSLLFMSVLLLILSGIYSLMLHFKLNAAEQTYFAPGYSTVIREVLWCFINMFLATGIYFIKKALDEKDMLLNLEKDNINFKLKYLRSQLNPHFLFNTLNSIYSLSLQKSDKAPAIFFP